MLKAKVPFAAPRGHGRTPTLAQGPAGVKRLLERGQEEKTNLLFFGNYEVTNYQRKSSAVCIYL